MDETASLLHAQGHGDRVLLKGAGIAKPLRPVLAYYSSGPAGHGESARGADVEFLAGSLAMTSASSGARTFREPPQEWVPTDNWYDPGRWFAGSPQPLAADLIREGATGVGGYIADPYFEGAIRPQILFAAYLAGRNLAESFYLAMPYLSWQTVVIGDPLCAPFARGRLASHEIDPGIDPHTELPIYFAQRWLGVARTLRIHPDAAIAAVRAEGRSARGDETGARAALEEALAVDPSFLDAYLNLALRHDEADHHDAAHLPYRRALQLQPDNVVALITSPTTWPSTSTNSTKPRSWPSAP